MSRSKGRDHDEEQRYGKRNNSQKVRVETDESIGGEKRESMGGPAPGEETDEPVLKDEDNPDACIESTEIVRHHRQAEGRARHVFGGVSVHGRGVVRLIHIVSGDDLLKDPASGQHCHWMGEQHI